VGFSFKERSQKCEKRLLASLCLSLRPSVRPHEITLLPLYVFQLNLMFEIFFENLSRKFRLHSDPTRITGTLHEDVSTFLTIFRWILLRMRNVLDKNCRENQNTGFMFNNVFRISCPLWDNVEKYCWARGATNEVTIWLIRVACWKKATCTHSHAHARALGHTHSRAGTHIYIYIYI
jgi:hypothetical protein